MASKQDNPQEPLLHLYRIVSYINFPYVQILHMTGVPRAGRVLVNGASLHDRHGWSDNDLDAKNKLCCQLRDIAAAILKIADKYESY
jgi:hypothetical protein